MRERTESKLLRRTLVDTLDYMERNPGTIEANLRVLESRDIGPKKSSRFVLSRLIENLKFVFSQTSTATDDERLRIAELAAVVEVLRPRFAKVGFRKTPVFRFDIPFSLISYSRMSIIGI